MRVSMSLNNSNSNKTHGKTVIITGASRGIGKAAAKVFAGKGYNLLLICKHSIEQLNSYADELHNLYNVNVRCFKCDISDFSSVEDFYKSAGIYTDDVCLLINNAGISIIGLLQDMSYNEWNSIVATNLSSVFYMCKNIIPHFLKNGSGKIINVSSVWGKCGASCEVAYSSTKGGINSFTKALAKELAPSNIQVNAVAFGAIDTDMNSFLDVDEKAELENEIPTGRMATPEEAARFIYTIFDSGSYLTGQVISFDGAWI